MNEKRAWLLQKRHDILEKGHGATLDSTLKFLHSGIQLFQNVNLILSADRISQLLQLTLIQEWQILQEWADIYHS